MVDIEPTEPRPPSRLDVLKERVRGGESVYSVIGSVLAADAREIDGYRLSHLARGENQFGLNQEIIGLYDLESNGLTNITELLLGSSRGFLDGFYYVSDNLYGKITVATRSEEQPTLEDYLRTTLGDRWDQLDNITKQALIKMSRSYQSVEGEYNEDIRQALQGDPSGGTWLRGKVRNMYGNAELELIGANRAVTGAMRLYETLRREIPSSA